MKKSTKIARIMENVLLQFPVSVRLNGMDRSNTHSNLSSKFATTTSCIQKHTDKNNMAFIQQCSAISRAFVGFVRHAISHVFVWGSVAKIASSIVVSVPIYVSNNHSVWSLSNKRLGYSNVDVLGCLRFVFWSFLERHGKIVCRRVKFSDKPFIAFNHCNASKVTNFVSIMPCYGHPNLSGVCHG